MACRKGFRSDLASICNPLAVNLCLPFHLRQPALLFRCFAYLRALPLVVQVVRRLSGLPHPKALMDAAPKLEASDILTPAELADRLKVGVKWIYGATHGSNPLPCLRCGRYLRFSWPDVVAWMRKG